MAQEINEQHQERLAPFAFSKCGIAIGEQIELCYNGNDHSGELYDVYDVTDDKHINYRWALGGPLHRRS